MDDEPARGEPLLEGRAEVALPRRFGGDVFAGDGASVPCAVV